MWRGWRNGLTGTSQNPVRAEAKLCTLEGASGNDTAGPACLEVALTPGGPSDQQTDWDSNGTWRWRRQAVLGCVSRSTNRLEQMINPVSSACLSISSFGPPVWTVTDWKSLINWSELSERHEEYQEGWHICPVRRGWSWEGFSSPQCQGEVMEQTRGCLVGGKRHQVYAETREFQTNEKLSNHEDSGPDCPKRLCNFHP